MGDFRDVLEVKLSVETELSLEDESVLLLDGPGLNINLVGTIFFTAGDKGGFTNDSEGLLVFIVGDCGVLVFVATDNDVFMIGDDGVFTVDDSGVLTVGDDGIFTTANGFVLATGDFGTKFLVTDDNKEVTLAFNVEVFDTAEVVDFIVEEDFTDSNDEELDSFLTIAFEVGFDLEITLDLLVDCKEITFAVLGGSLVNNFEGEVGVFKEIDFILEAVDRLFDTTGSLFVGILGLLTPTELLIDDIAAFLTGVVGFATVACSFDFNDVALTLIAVDATDLAARVELVTPIGDFGTTEFVVNVLDVTDVGGDLATGEDTANDFCVKVDFT